MSRPEGVTLIDGAEFTLTTERVAGTQTSVSTTYPKLAREVTPGEKILLDDGSIELEIENVRGGDVLTRVIRGGVLKPSKGINLPGTTLSVSALTDKDRKDAEFGLSLDVDFMALSFVRKADDILELKAFLAERGRADLPVIAKIEKPEALENLTAILDVADGVMVARGDLGVELPAEEVPMLQKKIIYEAHRRGRLVITATQMLESMIYNPHPTRAEASDVANAIIDGTDAVMLSGETAVGNYPVETVATMSRIANYTESMQGRIPWKWPSDTSLLERSSVSRAVAKAACRAGEELDARYLITFSESGSTARLLSHYRPKRPIIALTPSERVCRELTLPWGITPILSSHYETIEEMLLEGLGILKKNGLVATGDTAVVILGTTLLPGATDVMKVHCFK
jgi:pyruvate kinase